MLERAIANGYLSVPCVLLSVCYTHDHARTVRHIEMPFAPYDRATERYRCGS